MGNMSGFDVVSLVIIGGLGVRCLLRGFIKEVLSLVGIGGGIILSRLYHEQAAAVLFPNVKNPIQASLMGYAVICIGVMLAASIAARFIRSAIKGNPLGVADRVAGFCVGALQGAIIVGLFLFITESAISMELPITKNSKTAPALRKMTAIFTGLKPSSATPAKSSPTPPA